MATSFYDLTVGSFTQTVTAMAGVLERGLDHCKENNLDPEEIAGTRMFPNMLPFSFQIESVAHHSLGAIEAVKAGEFSPSGGLVNDYAGLQGLLADTQAGLKALTPDEVEALSGKDVMFKFRDNRIPFTAENFIMSFSIPNFHFHATTAYDILRMKGVPLGKRDYLGAMRIKT
jgi:hypothetical protein